ncbi:MAG TPA: BamA/TamA family outer membrane protein [Clostridiales bacterium]|nr:BamA/TamA family outer membrane protein [Clostridiales bacterium]HQP69430.1 BamA/TamA family outer membrane protein [Clostridiales bacterium]
MRSKLSFIIFITIFISLTAKDPIELIYSGKTYFTNEILDTAAGTETLPDSALTEGTVLEKINRLLDFYSSKGFPLAKIKVDSIISATTASSVYLSIDAGDYVTYNFITFSGNKISRSETLLKQSGLNIKMRFDEEKVNEAAGLIYSTGLFIKKPEFRIVRPEGEYGIDFVVEERKYIQISLMGGYSSGDQDDVFSGTAGLVFDNIFGTFRKASVYWDRIGKLSEKIKLQYREPFLLRYRISTGFLFEQNYKKDEFLSRQTGIDEQYTLNSTAYIIAGYKKSYLYTDSLYAGPDNDMVTDRISGGVRFANEFISSAIPVSGGYSVSAEIASLKIDIKDSTVITGTEIIVHAGFIKKFRDNFFIKTIFNYDHILSDSDLPLFGKIYFGGAESLRGFREDFFVSDIFLLQSAEFYFVPDSKELSFSLFFDNGLFNIKRKNIEKISGLHSEQSYGGGMTVIFGSGEIALTAGIPARYGIDEGMLHLRYSVRF